MSESNLLSVSLQSFSADCLCENVGWVLCCSNLPYCEMCCSDSLLKPQVACLHVSLTSQSSAGCRAVTENLQGQLEFKVRHVCLDTQAMRCTMNKRIILTLRNIQPVAPCRFDVCFTLHSMFANHLNNARCDILRSHCQRRSKCCLEKCHETSVEPCAWSPTSSVQPS